MKPAFWSRIPLFPPHLIRSPISAAASYGGPLPDQGEGWGLGKGGGNRLPSPKEGSREGLAPPLGEEV